LATCVSGRQTLLPVYEIYQAQRRGRTPFACPECFEEDDENGVKRKFTRSSFATHARSKKHRKSKSLRVDCNVCGEEFNEAEDAFDHFASSHRAYACADCGDDFPEFEKLKSHLRSSHRTEWPWICGFCDQPLLYELEFEVHVRQHTDGPPHECPICKATFEDTTEVGEHLAENHMPRMTKTTTAATIERAKMKRDKAADSSASAAAARDENAVNREIATLLLNLHASRGDPAPATSIASITTPAAASGLPKAEDLSVKSSGEKAMDLSGKQQTTTVTLNPPLPASISRLAKQPLQANGGGSLDLSKAAAAVSMPNMTNYTSSSSTSSPSSSFYPSLASLSSLNSSTALAMNSNYLLQNLLLGKMQQIAAASGGDSNAIAAAVAAASMTSTGTTTTSSSSAASSPLSFPTQPLPAAQALSFPATTSSLKPPASVMKSATTTVSVSNGGLNIPTTSLTMASNSAIQQLQLTESNTSTNIPLLCGQIVAQLNGLLFLVHGLNQPQIEMNLQNQLGAIYTRLQEVVTVVEQAKKQEAADASALAIAREAGKSEIQKTLEKMKENKLKEEESIAKQLQDYQRALLQQHQDATAATVAVAGKLSASQGTPLKETAASIDVVNLLKKHSQLEVELNGFKANHHAALQEAESTSNLSAAAAAAAARRRRGRPPKNSNLDLSYSPPDSKRARNSTDELTITSLVNGSVAEMNGGKGGQQVVSSGGNGGASGKGIRNRVFCGECAGCLKNDDCGRCRYCQDKTKFGGQNRLRQKCLHRRCLMDTHRKRSNNAANGSANSSNAAAAAAAVAAAVAASNAAVAAAAGNGGSYTDIHGNGGSQDMRSTSPSSIYSGVDLARLAACAAAASQAQVQQHHLQQQQQQKTVDQFHNGENEHDTGKDKINILSAIQHYIDLSTISDMDEKPEPIRESSRRDSAATIEVTSRRSTRSRQKSEDNTKVTVTPAVAAALGASNSDDDSDDKALIAGKTQSRIDKWKAKHEAMLKGSMAQDDGGSEGGQQDIVGEHVGEVKDEDEEEEEEEMEMGSAKEEENDPEEPEIPNIDGSNGVCIDLDSGSRKGGGKAGSAAGSKPHTRHSAVQQQALSV
jgi:hypothetical protein